MSGIRCTNCHADAAPERAGWMCRTCGEILPSDRPDATATAIAAKVARDLGCADIDDVPDALKRVLGDSADAEIHRRVLGQQIDAQRTRADAAEAECARLRVELAAVRSAVRMLDGARAAIDANGLRVLRSLAGEERAALLEELEVARRERDDWNALATAMESERDEARAAVAAERARCAAACREVVARYRSGACGCAECEGRRDGARECAEAIERGEVGR